MKVVVKAVNFILYWEFKDLLAEINSQLIHLLYFGEVSWVSREKMLERVSDFREVISTFLSEKKLGVQKFRMLNEFQNWHFSQI